MEDDYLMELLSSISCANIIQKSFPSINFFEVRNLKYGKYCLAWFKVINMFFKGRLYINEKREIISG